MREYLLLAHEGAKLAERGGGADRHDVRTRRHHLAHHRFAELDERPQELARLPLLQLVIRGRLDDVGRLRHRPRVLVAVAIGPGVPVPATFKVAQRTGQRFQEPSKSLERRQEELQHPLRFAADDDERDDVLADDHENEGAEHQQRQAARCVDPGDARQQRRRDDRDGGKQHARRKKEPKRLVEIAAERVAAIRAFRHDAERQAHQRAERGRHRAHVHRGHAKEKQDERGHRRGRDRAMSPDDRPARRRNRSSVRAITPSSCSWS